MQNDIPFIEPTPTLTKRSCRALVYLIEILLRTGSVLIALIAWYLTDWKLAIAFFLLGFLVMGILRAKLRNDSIPPAQQEYDYNDRAIAAWYVSRRLLCDYGAAA